MSITRNKIYERFGEQAFDHGLFYQHEGALRFCLTFGKNPLKGFVQAFDRVRVLLGPVVSSAEQLSMCLSVSGACALSAESRFMAVLDTLGFNERPAAEQWYEPLTERHFLLTTAQSHQLDSLLWLALSRRQQISPRFEGDIYLLWPEAGVLAYPYDVSFMDLIGSNHELLGLLYQSFQRYLAPAELPVMRRYFEGEDAE